MKAREVDKLKTPRSVMLLSAAALLAVTAGLLASCGGPGGAPQSITLYSGQHEQTTQSLITAFEKQTGIHVNVRYNDEDSLVNEIEAEVPHPKADVFYTENSPPLEFLQGQGLLAPVPGAVLAKTPAKYNSPQGDWVGVSARVSVIIYNPSLITKAQLPTTVLQLAEPRYKGKLALAPSETDFQPIVTATDRAYGQPKTLAWLRAIYANAAGHVYPDNETIADEVNRGAAAFGVVNQYYWYRLGSEVGRSHVHSRITYFAPQNPGYVVDISGAGVLESSKHKAAADRFLAFMVSKQGQEVIANSLSFEYPLDDGVQPGAPETPFSQLHPYPITIAQLGDGSLAISLMQKAGML